MESSKLRLLPIGRDIRGNQYWYQLDTAANLRIYKEQADDELSWSLICRYANFYSLSKEIV